LKTVRREEPIIRNRFVECPHCKTRNFRIKKTIDVGRCRKCRDSYKIITLFLKIGGNKGPANKELDSPQVSSWQPSSDSAPFGTTVEHHSTFSNPNFAWNTDERGDESETTSQ